MRTRILLALATVGLGLAVGWFATAQDGKPKVAFDPKAVAVTAAPVKDDRLPPPKATLGGVTVTADVAYSTLPGFRPLRLDVYAPTQADKPLPLIVYVHGGAWTIGTKRTTSFYEDFPSVLAGLAARGFVVAAVEYRLSGEAPFPAAVQDVKAALRFLRAGHKRFGFDPDRVAIWGNSAGAHLAALVAFAPGEKRFEPGDTTHARQSDVVQGFVGWYGPYDIGDMIRISNSLPPEKRTPQFEVEFEASCRFFKVDPKAPDAEALRTVSPLTYAGKAAPPSLLIHGTADTLVPYSQSVALEKKLKDSGAKVEFLTIEGVSHSWAGATLADTEAASRKALAATFDHFDTLFQGRR